MVSELCQVNTVILSLQAFILEADKMTDFLASIMVALYFCAVHIINRHTVVPLIDVDITRAVGYLSIFFVFLRFLDFCYC